MLENIEIVSHSQPKYNIGLVGSVSHGKSMTVKAFTGAQTFKFSKEKEKGITMKIGYANCKIFCCQKCPEPICYQSSNNKTKNHKCIHCNTDCLLKQYFSFIDCPGHESLMNIMLSGATVMDYAFLLIDATQKCPQPQTIEHLNALEILQIKKIIIIQNKLDLVEAMQATEQYASIKNFVKGTIAESAPIIPFCAEKKYNLDILCEFIIKFFGNPQKTITYPKMNIIRSFDVNKPGCTDIDKIVGGVLGGSIISGTLSIGDQVEIRPGLVHLTENTDCNSNFKSNSNSNSKSKSQLVWKPIFTTIVSMKSDTDDISVATSGGLIGLCTNLDPYLTRSDRMIGQVIGLPGHMPDVYTECRAKCIFMSGTHLPKSNSEVLLNISSKPIIAIVKKVVKLDYLFTLKYPCCMSIGENFSISSKINGSWKLIGIGSLHLSTK